MSAHLESEPTLSIRDRQYQQAARAMVQTAALVYRPDEPEVLRILRLMNRLPKMTKEEIFELIENDGTFRMLLINNQVRHQVNDLYDRADQKHNPAHYGSNS